MEVMTFFANSKNKALNIAIIIITLIIIPNIYKSQNTKIESLRAQRDAQIKKNETLSSISQLEKKLKDYKNMLNKKDMSLVINTVTNMARESNVKVISIEPRPVENYTAYVKHPFNLIINVSSYHAIGKFISKIENYADVFLVDTASILLLPKSNEPGQEYKLVVNLTISTFVFKD